MLKPIDQTLKVAILVCPGAFLPDLTKKSLDLFMEIMNSSLETARTNFQINRTEAGVSSLS